MASTAARAPVAARAAMIASMAQLVGGGVAAVGAGEVEHEDGEVGAVGHDGGEGGGHRGDVAPDEGVVVERVGDGDERAEDVGQRGALAGAKGGIGAGGCRRARSAIRLASPPEQLTEATAGPASGPPWCRSFRVSSRAARVATSAMPRRARKAEAAAAPPASEAVWVRVAARAGAERPALSATTGFASGAGLGGHRLEGANVAEALDVEAEGGDAGVVEERRGDVGEAGLGLVAGGHDVGERQARRCMVRLTAMLEDLARRWRRRCPPAGRRAGRARA